MWHGPLLKITVLTEGMSKCNSNFNFCEHCLYGKQNRVKFPSGATRAKGILELIHSDVFGPEPVPSLGGDIYYVSFIDDFSRNTRLYFLKNKSKFFSKFKEYKALVENQIGKKIKVLRTDNGGEFCEKEFKKFYKECGIARQKTTPYTPQQNGVVERMNRSLMEKVRSMLNFPIVIVIYQILCFYWLDCCHVFMNVPNVQKYYEKL